MRDLPELDLRSLYELYPDFAIDVEAEQRALLRAEIVVWQSPFYWYGLPALLHLWIEKVLARGFAYGPEGQALVGKTTLWVTTTGAPPSSYREGEEHGFPFDAFLPPILQTVRFCGMRWAPPVVVHGAHRISDATLQDEASRYRRVLALLAASREEAEDG